MPTYNEQMPMIDVTMRDVLAALERDVRALANTPEDLPVVQNTGAWQGTYNPTLTVRDYETWANVTTPVLPYDTQYRIWRQRRREGLPLRYALYSGTPEPIPGIWRDQYAAEDACAHLDGHVWRYFVVTERLHPRITIRNATTAD